MIPAWIVAVAVYAGIVTYCLWQAEKDESFDGIGWVMLGAGLTAIGVAFGIGFAVGRLWH